VESARKERCHASSASWEKRFSRQSNSRPFREFHRVNQAFPCISLSMSRCKPEREKPTFSLTQAFGNERWAHFFVRSCDWLLPTPVARHDKYLAKRIDRFPLQ
jgi:hypothetical protein